MFKFNCRNDKELQEEDVYSWNKATMNQAVTRMQYAVRGPIVMRANALLNEGKEIFFTNVGNPQAAGQKPNKFYRQVLALCDLPEELGIDNKDIGEIFPMDVITRAVTTLEKIGSSGTGAYTASQGVLGFRKDVAKFIEARDGHKSSAENIFLTNGASSAIDLILTSLISNHYDAVMIPIPQYPIYSATVNKLGGRKVGYYLNEDANWSITLGELEARFEEALNESLAVKALVIINPGNPTGQVLSRDDLETICLFCAKNGIVLLADEVYQRNVYSSKKKFISAKKVAIETPGCEQLQLISFHSTSKGVIGECGRRGGYMELHHIDPFVHSQVQKLASAGLCSNVPGQILTSLMVTPPRKGDPSYVSFIKEESRIFESLKRRAVTLANGLNEIDGIECNDAEGAMYVFPRLTNLPLKAQIVAKAQRITLDELYAMSLLEKTGVCVVPASGFEQAKGRNGFRTTFLLPEMQMIKVIDKIAKHHKYFCEKYS